MWGKPQGVTARYLNNDKASEQVEESFRVKEEQVIKGGSQIMRALGVNGT